MIRTLRILIVLMQLAVCAGATNYYVSPTGNNAADGLTPSTAWLSINLGDQSQLNVLIPADTVNILPGTYAVSNSITLASAGSPGSLIVYRKVGRGDAIVDLNNADKAAFVITASYVELHGVQIVNTRNNGITLDGHFNVIANCFIRDAGKVGIDNYGTNNLLFRNIIYAAGDDGIKTEDGGGSNSIYHNTIHAGGKHGIELKSSVINERMFNNIITSNKNRGISGSSMDVCAFNNVWGNPDGDYVGISDSAGGISVFPKFADTAQGRFDLKVGAGEIDAGHDLGYEFNGSAPDIGAIEKYNVYYVSPTGDDSANGTSLSSAWRTIDNGDWLLLPGDSVHILSGTYTDSCVLTASGAADNDRIIYHGARDSVTLNATGYNTGVMLSGDYVEWNGISVTSASNTDLYISGSGCVVNFSRFTNAGMYGVHTTGATDLYKNVFAFNNHSGAYEEAAGGASIYNNSFFTNQYFGFKTNSGLLSLTNDIFQDHDSAGVHAPLLNTIGFSMFFGNNTNLSGGILMGLTSITKNPQFVDPGAGNFFLSQGSPGIDGGANVGLPYTGSAPDIGAYESGVLAQLIITPSIDTLYADSVYQFSVIALDSSGLPANPGSLVWSTTFASGSVSSDGLFTPNLVGAGTIIVKSNIASVKDTSIVMHVVPGTLSSLTISPSKDTVSTDSTIQFSAAGKDIHGNTVSNFGVLSWSVFNGIGSIDAGGLFSANRTGKGFVRASSDLGPSKISDTILVVAGALSYLRVAPGLNTMIEDSSHQYAASGYDADSNLVQILTNAATWSTSDPTGSVTPTGLYTAGTSLSPPLYHVLATYSGLKDSGTVAIISSGTLDHVRIETASGSPVNDSTFTTDNDSTVLYCRSYDSGNNLIGDVSVTWSLIGADTIGTLSNTSGVSTTLELNSLGTARIVATYSASIADTTGTLTSNAGFPSRVKVTPDSAEITADSTVQFTVTDYDADGNITSINVIGSWSVIGSIGNISPGGLFTPGLAGDGRIAFTGALADTTATVRVVAGALQQIVVSPDTLILSADSVHQYEALGFDAHGNSQDPGSITWSVTGPIGSIDSTGLFDASTAGSARVAALSSLGPADTSSIIEVTPGRPIVMTISPDSAVVTADSLLTFTANGSDADGNAVNFGDIDWSVLGGIGDIDGNGSFSPFTARQGNIAAQSSIFGLVDTTGPIEVTPGSLVQLAVLPDTATTRIGDSVQYNVIGRDAAYNQASVGTLSWEVQYGKGTINDSGLFVAGQSGSEKIIATSSIGGITDTSGILTIEALGITAIPIGTGRVNPGQTGNTILSFSLENNFATDKQLTGLAFRSHSRGAGTAAQILAEINSIAVYMDTNGDSTLDPNDSLIAASAFTNSPELLTFAPLTIAAGSAKTFVLTLDVSSSARDGDSLDVMLLPGQDIATLDGTTVDGPDTVNSLGWSIIDGMVSSQISVPAFGMQSVSPGDSTYLLATVDLPRNGYSPDTLQVFTVSNLGTAQNSDFDSLMLYKDNGDAAWGGPSSEQPLGKLIFTGDRWTLSGLHALLNSTTNRFFVGGRISSYPAGGATIRIGIPINGIEVASGNDGPIDAPVAPGGTLTIATVESVDLEVIDVPGGTLIPGRVTPPLLAFDLVNNYATALELDSLKLSMNALDIQGASQLQLSSQIDSVQLYLNLDGNSQVIGDSDSLIATAFVENGRVTFSTGGFAIGAHGGRRSLAVIAYMDLSNSKNGNEISLSIQDSSAVYFTSAVHCQGSFPLTNSNSFTIDAFPAAAVAVQSAPTSPLFGGQSGQVVLDFTLPADGYSPAVLKQLTMTNTGTLDELDALSSIRLVSDRTGNGYSVDDSVVANFTPSAGSWSVSKLSYAIPSSGHRFLVVVDVINKQFSVGTLNFRIVPGSVKFASGTTGPDDVSVGNDHDRVVFPSDRVTAFAIPRGSYTVNPGSSQNVVLTFALYNGFTSETQHLTALRLTNGTRSVSTRSFADHELGLISLYVDSDFDRVLGKDSLLGTGSFVNGQLYLSGLNQALPAESLAYFFVVSDVPLNLIDSDSLSVQVSATSDLIFSSSIKVNGDVPLISGYGVVDGSIRDQYEEIPQRSRSITPGDTAITLAAFAPALNGDQVDQITSLTIENGSDADSSDIRNLRLWLDRNADDTWEETDSLVAAFSFVNGSWVVSPLSLTVSGTAPALMVVGDIADSAASGRAIHFYLPLNGCRYASDNDGPRDSALTIGNKFTISRSGLSIAYSLDGYTYSVGQTVPLTLTVTNLLDTTIGDVSGAVIALSDSSVVTQDSGSTGPVSLGGGESTEFTLYYTASSVGTNMWQVRAEAPSIGENSAIIQTEPILVQSAPTQMRAQLINSIPTSVTRGQTNLFPLSVKLTHLDTASTTASIRMDSLTLHIETGTGTPCPASNVFSRMVLFNGYQTLAVIDSIPDQPSITLKFTQSVMLSPGAFKSLSLLVDIDSAASVNSFDIVIASASDLICVDNNTDLVVPYSGSVSFPMKTASCDIDDPSQEMMIAGISLLPPHVNYGQQDVPVERFYFRHPGTSGSSQIQLTSIALNFYDTLGNAITPSGIFSAVRIKRQQSVVAELTSFDPDSTRIHVPLNTPLTLSPGNVDSLRVCVDVDPAVSIGGFSLTVPDSTAFVVRDLSSGSLIDAVSDTASLATGAVFPISSSVASFLRPSANPMMCIETSLPPSIIAGADSVSLLRFVFGYPDDSSLSPVRVTNIAVNVLDSVGKPLFPTDLFDKVGFRLNGGPVWYDQYVPLNNGAAKFNLSDTGVVLDPGSNVTIDLVADIEVGVPYDNFVLLLGSDAALSAEDFTDTTREITPMFAISCENNFPFMTSVTSIYQPAGSPRLVAGRLPVQIISRGQQGVELFESEIAYTGSTPQGDLALRRLSGRLLRHAESGYTSASASAMFDSVLLLIDDQVVASDSVLDGDSVVFVLSSPSTITFGTTAALKIVGDVKSSASLGNFLLSVDDSTSLDFADEYLATRLYPTLAGAAYPLRGIELSIAGAGLENSFVNYPNPFNPSRGEKTKISFVLPEDAYVDIDLYTITGDFVKTVANQSFRTAGAHQSDSWDGVNDAGRDVFPGTYFCTITAHYSSGKTESYRRKVAVLR